MSIVDNAVYTRDRDPVRPTSLHETYQLLQRGPALAWIGLYQPDEHELASLAAEFDLHELAVEDAIHAHQRPKAERYGSTLFLVLHAARYDDAAEEVRFSEVHVFVGANFVLTIRHGAAPNDLPDVRRRVEDSPELMALGPEAVLYAILDRVVDGYRPVIAGLENDVEEIEAEVFRGDPNVSQRIYELSREAITFQRATRPLVQVITNLQAGFVKHGVDPELQRYLGDVQDHLLQVVERVDGLRNLLRDALTVNATVVAQRQNEEMTRLTYASNAQNEEVKRISSWAAILFAPTVVAAVYGMNFDNMPELHWRYGYPFAVLLMIGLGVALWGGFKHRGWL